ncbi:response regulator receiver domain protein [Marvinbryantia formatexigens DSM 14469]|uniref:Stage 0 sporulation protein A homolog n=1 Tax=Marvinbryantia formatexigens DSM 14469 TaxID=478749 RepID=C6LAV1_9FIRM|nr:response regulator transcription factor [Marvinbryantia formatexigens]EET62082.1 response regulator receiver domain protein [Marvinbryantia formatexigens DSM 14469]UWO26555.1 response regulator transcription factor [Marvinbryantia formatexigens DSM 14469]SDF76238.1 two-component system, OmpR family, alkaline phosphatase synthesis response regulator PhoP [Marvinbryantia formatexigens]
MSLIYILEDDKNIREIESYSLKNSGYSVEEFEYAKPFWNKVSERKPDLVLLDIMLPDSDGVEVLKKLRRNPETKKVPVVMVTAKSSEIDKVKGLDNGADDYITKPFGVMELISRVKAVLRRVNQMEEEKLMRLHEIFMDNEKRMVYVSDVPCELTYKEFELLKLFLQNAGIVMARESIMERVWGVDFEGESRTLDMHIKTLRQKLGVAGKYIKTVRNVGYRIE